MIPTMSTSLISNLQSKLKYSWPSLIQLVSSVLAAFLLFGAAAIIALYNGAKSLMLLSGSSDLTQSFMIAASLAFAGVLVLPSAWFAWRRIAFPQVEYLPRPEPRWFGLILTFLVLVLVGGALLLGNWASQNTRISWFLLPPLNIIATGLPALWLVYIGTRGLIPGSPARRWGVFASGLVLGPFIILILELILLIVVGILAILWAALDPSLANQLNGLVFRLQNIAPNPDAILRLLLPFLLNPGILFILFAFISLLVPMIEEALKPIGVWFLVGQKITPAQGFGYGILSGAGFGLFENLGNTSNGGDAWALLASSRISTLLLHCFTAGLVGWALVSAWTQRRYLRLVITYAIAVLVHGLWNGMAVLSAISSVQSLTDISISPSLLQIGSASAIGIVALGALILVLFIGFNAVLRRGQRGMLSPSSFDHTAPNIPGNNPLPPPLDEPSQPSSVISPSLHFPPGDNPPASEGSTQHLPEEDNPPTYPGSNP
jgi:hypothetical protein